MSAPGLGMDRNGTLRLDCIAEDSWYSKGLNTCTVEYCGGIFSRFWKGRRCLEMGPAEGVMTPQLYRAFPELTLVEGAEAFCGDLRDWFPNATVVHSLFEDFAPEPAFSTRSCWGTCWSTWRILSRSFARPALG